MHVTWANNVECTLVPCTVQLLGQWNSQAVECRVVAGDRQAYVDSRTHAQHGQRGSGSPCWPTVQPATDCSLLGPLSSFQHHTTVTRHYRMKHHT